MKRLKSLHKKQMQKRLLAAVIVAAVGIVDFSTVSATSLKDAQDKKNEAQSNLDDINNTIGDLKSEQSQLENEKSQYDSQLMSLLTDMDVLEQDIANKQDEIDHANADLETAQQQEQTQYDSMKVRIQYMYEQGNDSVWTAIIGAKSITDLLNRVEYVSEVYDYDRKQLTAYQETVQQVADLTEQLKNEMDEMEELQLSYEEQKTQLDNVIADLGAQISDFDTQLANAKTLASQYAKTIKEQNDIIAKEEQKKKDREAAAAAAAATSAKSNTTASTTTAATGGTDNTSNTGSGNTDAGLTDTGLNPSFSSGVSGSEVVSYACQFVGNPYVFGGTSLTEGADCSGFIQSVYAHFGISLPRTSGELRSAGKEVSYANAQAGDIICYAGHVAIYMGNGQIVHASSPTTGIKYGTATYRTILSVRRVL
ncbi:C40 family peptidase [Roseburia sp. 831b]|uniref:C40 family peptidase n=1 Tax=Roseburia sp. 831b TaxID=1261635 RepID=UPI0009526C9C|nr:C40 family peptidase [Roseburia sp. 831b]WVK72162.1 NlpC/P60 family protein [Roseburia sp. 831b]